MSFKDQTADDAVNVFLNSDEFAEFVTYTPKNSSLKSIKAVVNREPMRIVGGSRQVAVGVVEIEVANDATYGVTTVKESHDIVTLPYKVGGTPEDFVVQKILGQDEGMWRLECYRG